MSKGISILAETRQKEHYKSLMEMPARDMCEMIRAHFESHPTLPGEKDFKDKVNHELERMEQNENAGLSAATKAHFAKRYSQTRIRETSIENTGTSLFCADGLKRDRIAVLDKEIGFSEKNPVYVDKVKVELQNNNVDVYVMAEMEDGGLLLVGKLSDKFLHNNPMNVDSCKAELQIADYSNGQLKNVSTSLVVDTDLMSGDVIDLDDDLLAGLNQKNGLEQ